ncbi:hypothetical protein QBC32DRAFT_338001 [Pseudoneurospora amorphoporcata]|uniref:C2H2-type domain-containing protein n=1 Tax=Pseudoneurospora amorphoporcata TaxID=241081 RepID=A0AAN6NZK1_9PEZI|nr:hypothetical protein QBC32DRAFT_338001 [Pseudoneurospora amorphoporcata]
MDFLASFQGHCPLHFPVNANGMASFGNDGDQIHWDGLDLEQAADPFVCLCPEAYGFSLPYPGDHDGDSENAGGLVQAGYSAGNNMTAVGQSLAHKVPAPGTISNNANFPKSQEAFGSASAEPTGSQTPCTKVYTCDYCGSVSAKTPRDFSRHLATKKHRKNAISGIRNGRKEAVMSPANPSTGFRCPVPPCDKVIQRKDNLWRHIAKMHEISDRGA